MIRDPAVSHMSDGRVVIRRIDLTDVDAIFSAVRASLPALSAWMPWAHEGYSRDDACWFVANAWLSWRSRSAFEFLVASAADGRLLGLCGLNAVSAAEGRANLGYWVHSAEAGRGVSTAAARLVARFGFEQVGLQRIRLFHAVGNIGSQRVAEKVGFVLEGVQRRRIALHGVQHDAKLYALVDVDEVQTG